MATWSGPNPYAGAAWTGPNAPGWVSEVDKAGLSAAELQGATTQTIYNAMLETAKFFNVPEAWLIRYIKESGKWLNIADAMRAVETEAARAQAQQAYAAATPEVKQQMDRQAFTQWWHNLLTRELTEPNKALRMAKVHRAVTDNNLHGMGVSDDEIGAYLINTHRDIMEETLSTPGVERQALYLNTKYSPTVIVPPRNPPFALSQELRQGAIQEANAARVAAGMPPVVGGRRHKKTKKQAMKKRKSKSRRNNKKTYRRPLFSY